MAARLFRHGSLGSQRLLGAEKLDWTTEYKPSVKTMDKIEQYRNGV